MFKKIQIKMTLYYTFILIVIILSINTLTYSLLTSINSKQLSEDIKTIISSINESDWIEVTSIENYKEEDSSEEKEDEDEDSKPIYKHPTSTIKILTPSTLKAFNFYYIYSKDGKLINYDVIDENLNTFLKEEILKQSMSSEPILTKYEDGKIFSFLTVKMPIYYQGNDIGYFYVGKDISLALDTINQLLKSIIAISILGILISFIIGYLIAKRIIKPIKNAYEIKQQFLADASHELRTPLSIISLSTEVLNKEVPKDREFIHQIIYDIFDETSKMTKLVNNLLFLARTDNKVFSINKEKTDLYNILKSSCNTLNILAREKNISLINDAKSGFLLYIDPDLMKTAICIIIENAIKYTEKNGIITITSEKLIKMNKEFISFTICDTGMGINKSDIPKIFNRFYRAESSRSKKNEGYGLGLSILKEIIDKHNGSIIVTSEIGKGSCFKVILPKE